MIYAVEIERSLSQAQLRTTCNLIGMLKVARRRVLDARRGGTS